ncbi:kinase-like protein [Rhizopogon salebrosus TDB-379]|nr:kinase-like protein [Rhizopogon salebrosus TDB-379]
MSSTQNHLSRRTQVPHIRIESPSSSDQTRRVLAQLEADPFSYSMYQPPLYMSSSTLFSGEGYESPNHQFSPMDELSNDSFSLGDLGLDMSFLSEITPQHSQEFCDPFLTIPGAFGPSGFQVIPPSPPPETAVNSPFTPVFTPSPTSSYGSPSPIDELSNDTSSLELDMSLSDIPPQHSQDLLRDLSGQLQGRPDYPTMSGGFGDIWKCKLVKPNETVQVAVKTIRAFESDDDVLVRKKSRRVRRELKVWRRLKHDCILPLWGVAGNFGPYPAMICPWVVNGALTGFLERRQATLSSRDKFSLLSDITLGLQYLHSKSIVHGDLTGSNVLVHGDGRACLADFGLSTMVLEFLGPSYLTSSINGNIRWAAAELFEVPEDEDDEASVSLSIECDIYSFGSIALQVLTCKVPYYNVKKDNVVLGQVMKGKKPEPPKESQIVPLHWEFIQRCWLPRANRPSVEEIVEFVTCQPDI